MAAYRWVYPRLTGEQELRTVDRLQSASISSFAFYVYGR